MVIKFAGSWEPPPKVIPPYSCRLRGAVLPSAGLFPAVTAWFDVHGRHPDLFRRQRSSFNLATKLGTC